MMSKRKRIERVTIEFKLSLLLAKIILTICFNAIYAVQHLWLFSEHQALVLVSLFRQGGAQEEKHSKTNQLQRLDR